MGNRIVGFRVSGTSTVKWAGDRKLEYPLVVHAGQAVLVDTITGDVCVYDAPANGEPHLPVAFSRSLHSERW